jgi:membrane-associated phospholipid phosphatase
MWIKSFSTEIADLQAALPRPLPAAMFGVFLLTLGAAMYFATAIDNFPGEINASLWIQSHRSPALDTLMKAISETVDKPIILPVLIVISVIVFLKGWRSDSFLFLAASVGGYAGVIMLKQIVARPRPSADIVEILGETSGFSFPSAHVMVFTAILGTLAFILMTRMRQGALRMLAAGVLVFILLAMGYSRIYLGAHWLGDVIGGYAFGTAMVIAFIWLWRLWEIRKGVI